MIPPWTVSSISTSLGRRTFALPLRPITVVRLRPVPWRCLHRRYLGRRSSMGKNSTLSLRLIPQPSPTEVLDPRPAAKLRTGLRGNERNRDTLTSCPRRLSPVPVGERASGSGVLGWFVHNPAFTLLEVVVALTLFGILLAILALQLQPLLAQTHLHDATRQMIANLQYVRMKAVSQNRRLRVTFRP